MVQEAQTHHLENVLPKEIMKEHHKEYQEFLKENKQKEEALKAPKSSGSSSIKNSSRIKQSSPQK